LGTLNNFRKNQLLFWNNRLFLNQLEKEPDARGGNMTNKYIEVLNPTGVTKQQNIKASSGVGDLNGKTIGFIDNGKPNYDIFLGRVVELLSQRFKFAGIIQVKKKERDTGAALNSTDVEKLVSSCDIIFNGICD
jgi:hypothetical protein